MNVVVIAHSIIVSVWLFNLASMVPQIVLNYHLKYGKGISDIMLLANLNGFVFGLLYIYSANLPLLYKIFSPLSCLLLSILIMQRMVYRDTPSLTRQDLRFMAAVGSNVSLLTLCTLAAYLAPTYWAPIFGWTSLTLMTVYQLPQLGKIIQQQSTYGFSFSYLTCMTMSAVLEMIAAIILDLPLIVKLNGVRALLLYGIFAFLFWYYPRQQRPQ